MKKRFDLEKFTEHSGWIVIASSTTSTIKTLAAYKTGQGRDSGNNYFTIEGMKRRGVKLRMKTTVITEVTESIEDI